MFRKLSFLLALTSTGAALADGRFTTDSAPAPVMAPIVLAQNNFAALGETEMRRMVFYAERALKTLTEVVNVSEARNTEEQGKINTLFRSAIVRLADAGQRSGLSSDQVADFFTQTILENEGQAFLDRAGEIGGGLDFRTVFRNALTTPNAPAANLDSNAEFLNALSAASDGLSLTEPQADSVITEVTPPPQVVGPVALANANTAEREVIDRVVVNGTRWELTIQQGDSLSEISSALYGDTLSYTIIFDANRNVLTDPNALEVDTVIVLPKR